jgi:hypothetical protein
MTAEICLGETSDYAYVDAGAWSLYYGYEFDRDGDEEVWGFSAKRDGAVVLRVRYDAMAQLAGCPDRFACGACLLFGIGLMLAAMNALEAEQG